MQETVTSTNERKSLFSSFLDVLEAREKQAQSDRQLQEEKYLRRTQRIYDFHGKGFTFPQRYRFLNNNVRYDI